MNESAVQQCIWLHCSELGMLMFRNNAGFFIAHNRPRQRGEQTGRLTMNAKELADKLDGLEYPPTFDKDMLRLAKEAGLVIVTGASDDLTEFDGAISEEESAWEGATHWMSGDGLYPGNQCENDDCPNYIRPSEKNAVPLKAIWCERTPDPAWRFEFALPHETFSIMEDGKVYCVGIVFALADVAEYLKKQGD